MPVRHHVGTPEKELGAHGLSLEGILSCSHLRMALSLLRPSQEGIFKLSVIWRRLPVCQELLWVA